MVMKMRLVIVTFYLLFIMTTAETIPIEGLPIITTGSQSYKSYHGTYLSGNQDGTVSLKYNLQDWEIWKWVYIGNNNYNHISYHGTYLSARQDGTVTLVKQPKQWEQWTPVVQNGLVVLKSYHGTFLSAEINMKVSLKPKADTWEQWKPEAPQKKTIVISQGPSALRSFHGTYLSAAYDGSVRLRTSIGDQEKWTWLYLGEDKFAWKSFHNTYLSARPDGSVKLMRLLQSEQVWARVDQNDKRYWKSAASNKFLSGRDDLSVTLMEIPQGWEEWTEIDYNAASPSGSSNNQDSTSNNRPQAPGTNLRIINNCPYTIWPGLDGLNNDNSKIFGDKNSANPAGFQLKSGQQKVISLANGAIGVRVWARLRCSYQTNNAWPDVKTRFLCEVGQCGNPLNKWDGTCFTSGGEGGNTLAQFTMTKDGHWWYDISLVDGYTIPVSMTPFGKISTVANVVSTYNCQPTSCFPDQSFNQCPPELKKFSGNTPISCYSISKAINDNSLKQRTPQLQGYYNDPKIRSHTECSCIAGSCAGSTANQVASNIKPETGFCCSPLNPLYLDPRIKDHICYSTDKPRPLNNFGGGKRYDQIFKNICPKAYSWEFDDNKSTYECMGKDVTMEVKFC